MTLPPARTILLAHSRPIVSSAGSRCEGLLSLAIAELIVLASAGVPLVVFGVSM